MFYSFTINYSVNIIYIIFIQIILIHTNNIKIFLKKPNKLYIYDF